MSAPPFHTDFRVIAFDADDTLWVNETYFREAENEFCASLEDYLSFHRVHQELFKTEIKNLDLYGYGIKGFTLSMIETAFEVTDGQPPLSVITKAIEIGQRMLSEPIELLEGVEDTLRALSKKYRLIVATKGDLLDQERKLERSGLASYFHHVEVMSNKKVANYERLFRQIDVEPAHFLMIGNSLKSDIAPVLELGGHAVHIPFHTTWAHETITYDITHPNFRKLSRITDLIPLVNS
ncbi:MAG: HAD family hydrolase [Bacteroidota bacterium]